MPENAKPVAYVKKQGQVFTLYVDQGSVVPIEDFHSPPAVGEIETHIGLHALKARLPQHEIVFVEDPSTKPAKAVVGEVDMAAVNRLKQNFAGAAHTPAPELKRAKATAPPRAVTGELSLALTYLDKLQCALRYASDENKEVLKLKIETAEEMIHEVFGERRHED